MTMQECIEQRKTVLTAAVDSAPRDLVTVQDGSAGAQWGIDMELVQVAQVFIVDTMLRKQLEAEVRNEIRLKSEHSDIHTQQEINSEARLSFVGSENQLFASILPLMQQISEMVRGVLESNGKNGEEKK